jgi:hypothetical protein
MLQKKTMLFLAFCGFIHLGFAQEYGGAFAINPADSSLLTASAISLSGEVATGSLKKQINISGGSGLPNSANIGEMVLRKLAPDLSIDWQVDFPNSKARILSTRILANGDIVISGAYRDTLEFSTSHVFFAHPFRANAFMACYDGLGTFKWAYAPTPHPNFSNYFYTFAIKDDEFYIPYSRFFNSDTKLFVIDNQGDSVRSEVIADGPLFVSEIEFDHNGELYLCGTADPLANLGGAPIGTDSTLVAYSTFIGKLDTSYQQLWSDKFRYITIDFHPSMALTGNQVALLVDSMPQQNGTGNFHMLKFYSPGGVHLKSDSIGPGFFSPMHRTMALHALGTDFIYASISGFDTITINKVDQQYNHQRITTVIMNEAQERPWMIANDSVLYYNHSFYDTAALVNLTDTVFNAKMGQSVWNSQQQILVKIKAGNSIGVTEYQTENDLLIYPNPVNSTFHFRHPEFRPGKIAVGILSLAGKTLISREIDYSNNAEVAINHLPPGVYIVHVSQANKTYVQKIMKL